MRRGARRERDKLAQDTVEKIGLALLVQYPTADDAEIAQLMRDELHNRHARDPALFRWADAETAGRLRRTAVRAALGHIKTEDEPPPEKKLLMAAITATLGKDGKCSACGATNPETQRKCIACGRTFAD
jgi:hypothetical protein